MNENGTHRGLTRAEMETRRLAAAAELVTLKPRDYGRQAEIAKKYHVSRTTASRWTRALETIGPAALLLRKAPGRPSRLTKRQLKLLCQIQTERPLTGKNLAIVIERRFGIRYDTDHVGRLIKKLKLPVCGKHQADVTFEMDGSIGAGV
jgi:transposase